MPAWNETHYARAQEFTRLLADALAAATPPPAPAPSAPSTPSVPSAPSVASTSAPATPPATPGTAASVFKKIPWKK